MTEPTPRRRKLGLALGSGSARGLAHLGVIRALKEFGHEPDIIVGTSIGALIGAIYAAGKLDQLQSTLQDFDWKKTVSFFDVVLPKSGLLDGVKVSNLVRDHVQTEVIESLEIPFAAVATDLIRGDEVLIRTGDVIEAVRASISVPGIFTPVRRNGHFFVDGGLTNPVPVSAARAMGADIVIAVDLNFNIVAGKNFQPLFSAKVPPAPVAPSKLNGAFTRWIDEHKKSLHELKLKMLASQSPQVAQFARWASHEEEPQPNIFEVLLAAVNVMETQITQSRLDLDRPEILIRPPLGHIRFLEFNRAEEIINIGYEHTCEVLKGLPLQTWS